MTGVVREDCLRLADNAAEDCSADSPAEFRSGLSFRV